MIETSPTEEMNSGDAIGGLSGADPQANPPASEANGKTQEHGGHSLDFILDVPLTITVELGTSKMTIREVLLLAVGSVVESSKFAGEPLEILVNNRLIARGEVVVVNEKYGVRLTDVISPTEHLK